MAKLAAIRKLSHQTRRCRSTAEDSQKRTKAEGNKQRMKWSRSRLKCEDQILRPSSAVCLLLLAGQPLFILVSGGKESRQPNGILGNTKQTHIKFPLKCHGERRGALRGRGGREREVEGEGKELCEERSQWVEGLREKRKWERKGKELEDAEKDVATLGRTWGKREGQISQT